MDVLGRQRIAVERRSHSGGLASGSRYLIEEPEVWNGVLLLYSKPIPVRPGEPPWPTDEPLVHHLVDNGFAVAGCANTIFWPLERAFSDHPALLDVAEEILGPPRVTVGCGLSIGGAVIAGLVQVLPGRLSGALSMCGNLAGAVAVHNRELDMAFVVKTLLAPDSALQLVHITNARANLAAAEAVLHEAQTTAAGRARLALAAAVGNIPGWHDPPRPEPAPDDVDERQRSQFAWFQEPGFLVFFLCRYQVELQAGGNPSWNTGVDYRALLSSSISRDEVTALYRSAGLDLEDDLDRLDAAPRIEADPEAVAYLERNIVFNGDLGGVPVLSMHTEGDGLVTPDNARAYADVVATAGNGELLRQLWVHRAGHCSFTFAEITTALHVLLGRIETGTWPTHDPETLNGLAGLLGTGARELVTGSDEPGDGETAEAAFFEFDPPPFPRRHDVRDSRS